MQREAELQRCLDTIWKYDVLWHLKFKLSMCIHHDIHKKLLRQFALQMLHYGMWLLCSGYCSSNANVRFQLRKELETAELQMLKSPGAGPSTIDLMADSSSDDNHNNYNQESGRRCGTFSPWLKGCWIQAEVDNS
jgi:hypothetical protein